MHELRYSFISPSATPFIISGHREEDNDSALVPQSYCHMLSHCDVIHVLILKYFLWKDPFYLHTPFQLNCIGCWVEHIYGPSQAHDDSKWQEYITDEAVYHHEPQLAASARVNGDTGGGRTMKSLFPGWQQEKSRALSVYNTQY